MVSLVFYVRSATWAVVWEMNERGKGLETRRLVARGDDLNYGSGDGET